MGETAVSTPFPRVYSLPCFHNVPIASLCVDSSTSPLSWDFGFHGSMRGEASRVIGCLRNICLVQVEDYGSWSLR